MSARSECSKCVYWFAEVCFGDGTPLDDQFVGDCGKKHKRTERDDLCNDFKARKVKREDEE